MTNVRLDGRNGAVWAGYLSGRSQYALAEEFGISQQRVSQIIKDARETIGEVDRLDAAALTSERLNALLSGVWAAALDGDSNSTRAALKVIERQCKMLGLDATEPLHVVLERRRDLEGGLVAGAVGAALDALGLDPGQLSVALGAAQAHLSGETPEPAAETPVHAPETPEPAADPMAQAMEQMGISLSDLEGADDDE